jgi:hypothetical protein
LIHALDLVDNGLSTLEIMNVDSLVSFGCSN